jgi:hypothetical protein
VEVDGVRARVAFEVFDSEGKWDFLFGKSLLETYKAVHDYELDEIILKENGKTTTLLNQSRIINQVQSLPTLGMPVCVVTEEPPQDEGQPAEVNVEAFQGDANLFTCMTHPFKRERVQEILHLVTIGEDLLLGSPIQSGFLSKFGKTRTGTGLPRLRYYEKPD